MQQEQTPIALFLIFSLHFSDAEGNTCQVSCDIFSTGTQVGAGFCVHAHFPTRSFRQFD